MSSVEKDLYKNIKIETPEAPKPNVPSRAYRGTSTVNNSNKSFALYDIGLIKQDLLNHFHIRQGERLENPEFGCIIWDALFEPLTETLKEAIAKNVTQIVNYDPRIIADKVLVDEYQNGILIELQIRYSNLNQTENLKLLFDQNVNSVSYV